jgi:hypothetical protein
MRSAHVDQYSVKLATQRAYERLLMASESSDNHTSPMLLLLLLLLLIVNRGSSFLVDRLLNIYT